MEWLWLVPASMVAFLVFFITFEARASADRRAELQARKREKHDPQREREKAVPDGRTLTGPGWQLVTTSGMPIMQGPIATLAATAINTGSGSALLRIDVHLLDANSVRIGRLRGVSTRLPPGSEELVGIQGTGMISHRARALEYEVQRSS